MKKPNKDAFFSEHIADLEKEIDSVRKRFDQSKHLIHGLRAIIENNPDPVAGLDKQLRFFAHSKRYIIDFKLNFTDLIGKQIQEVFPNIGEDWLHDFEKCLHGAVIGPKKIKVVFADGNAENIIRKLIPLKAETGSIEGVIVLNQITTRQDQVEAAMIASEGKYRELVENINDAIYIVSQRGVVTFVSPVITQILGFLPEEIIGKNFLQFVHPDDHAYMLGEIPRTRQPFFPLFECRLIHKDTTERWVRVSNRSIYAKGRLKEMRGVLHDISKEKQAEKENLRLESLLHQAKRMEAIGTLAGGVAHDLNNILSGVVSYPDLLLLELPENSPHRPIIETIKKSGERAAVVVQDLLTLARRGLTGAMAIDMNQLIAEYIDSPETELLKSTHPNLRIAFDPEDTILPIHGSPVHLKKVLMNLVNNAAEAMLNGGSVTIATRNKNLAERLLLSGRMRAGDYVEVTVTDNGVGIGRNDVERIFEPFYTTKSMGRSGTGLGMAVVWSSVQDHQGYIDIASQVGAGTTITLFFPTTSEKPRTLERRNTALEDLQGEGEVILVVDDVDEQLEIASNILRKLGYQVETASSGEAAVTYLKTSVADLVVLDMVMPPGIDGLETFKQITAVNPEQRAIIASGFAETERVQEALRSGIDSFVRKPYSLRNFGYAVKSALSNR